MRTQHSLTDYLPKKKYPYVLLVIVLITGGMIVSRSQKNEMAQAKADNMKNGEISLRGESKTKPLDRFVLDTDNDGLKDWEEAVLKSDPNNKDTDDDGVPDGQELKEGRSPLLKGPNDTLSEAQKKSMEQDKTKAGADMGNILHTMLSTYVASKQSGTLGSPKAQTELSAIAAKEVSVYSASIIRTDTYGMKDIKISEDSSASALRAYGNTMGEILKKYDRRDLEPELIILYKAMQLMTKDQEQSDAELALFGGYVDYFDKVVAGFLTVPAPRVLATEHVNLINGIVAHRDVLNALRGGSSDPLAVLAALQKLRDVSKIFGSANHAIDDILKKNEVVFAKEEAGWEVFGDTPEDLHNAFLQEHAAEGILLDASSTPSSNPALAPAP